MGRTKSKYPQEIISGDPDILFSPQPDLLTASLKQMYVFEGSKEPLALKYCDRIWKKIFAYNKGISYVHLKIFSKIYISSILEILTQNVCSLNCITPDIIPHVKLLKNTIIPFTSRTD